MNYEKEKRKMIVLLIAGVVLAIVFFSVLGYLNPYSYVMYSFFGMIVLFGLIFYPLALVHGRAQIVDVFHSIRGGDRQPFRLKPGNAFNIALKALNLLFALFTTIFLGWAYGAYTAYQKLQYAKRFGRKIRR
ncbi:hypothetical protein [Lysinibacillus sp. 54212]|uniref:hypothetical protein n=1 Tax=Lysinibacillus sp. 54212 TaxID=3119829 RepID=UPI002FCC1A3E